MSSAPVKLRQSTYLGFWLCEIKDGNNAATVSSMLGQFPVFVDGSFHFSRLQMQSLTGQANFAALLEEA